MLFDLVDMLQKRRRLVFVTLFIVVDFLLLTVCTQVLQAHRSAITERIHNSEGAPALSEYQSDLYIDSISANVAHIASTVEVGVLRAVVAVADDVTKTEHGLQAASTTIAHAVAVAATATVRATGRGLAFAGHVVTFPFVATSHGVGHVLGAASGLTHSGLTSVIQPDKNIVVPVITPEQAHQAFLIQSGTLDVKPVKPTGSGGVCDNGAGNGGYPMDWCDAPMDTVRTVSYSSDRINRECTSYAYWYFTTVEGHSDFHVTGNANRWASTSNIPTHGAPAVGAIAVETAGAYGHVAIVQALPGQTHDGNLVPVGYVLVSEMNYDWHCHFRYSYSPLSKFSAYIYP